MRKVFIVMLILFSPILSMSAQGQQKENDKKFNAEKVFPTWTKNENPEKLTNLRKELEALQNELKAINLDACPPDQLGGSFCQTRLLSEYRNKEKEIEMKRNEIGDWEAALKLKNEQEGKIQVQGIIGHSGDKRFLLDYIPRLIDILLKFIAPLVLAMFIYSGIRFIYAGDDEEDLTQSKQFFMYSLMGVLFVILSYSIMKSVYYIFSL